MPVVAHGEVLEGVVEQRRGRGELQGRERQDVPRELLGDLGDVVAVDVAVTADPDEVPRSEADLLGRDDRPARTVLFPSSAGFTAACNSLFSERAPTPPRFIGHST